MDLSSKILAQSALKKRLICQKIPGTSVAPDLLGANIELDHMGWIFFMMFGGAVGRPCLVV